MRRAMFRFAGLFKFVLPIMALGLAACAHNPRVWEEPKLLKESPVHRRLAELPAPGQRIAVAVYGFTDQTGQFKPSDTVQTLSRAVTQGATSILVKTLQDAGQRQWFQVIERERLDNVLRERAVIREMRASYLGETKVNPDTLPPLLVAGVLLEGGIISYDSNTKTGGLGGRFLGIGGNVAYREDTVTIYLRAVSVKTGEVLSSVSVRKSIAAVAIGASTFRFVDFRDLLEVDTGISYNEPDQIALSQAIEKGVYALIMEGALNNLWCFTTTEEDSRALLSDHLAERDSVRRDRVSFPRFADGRELSGMCSNAAALQAQRLASAARSNEQTPLPAPANQVPDVALASEEEQAAGSAQRPAAYSEPSSANAQTSAYVDRSDAPRKDKTFRLFPGRRQ